MAAVLRLLKVSNRTQVVVAISRMSNAGPVRRSVSYRAGTAR